MHHVLRDHAWNKHAFLMTTSPYVCQFNAMCSLYVKMTIFTHDFTIKSICNIKINESCIRNVPYNVKSTIG